MFFIFYLIIIALFSNILIAESNMYDMKPFNRLNDAVQRYINTPTKEIVAKVGTPADVAQSFKKEFCTPSTDEKTTDDEQTNERQKNNQCMQIVRQMVQKKDGSLEHLNAIEFVYTSANDFDKKAIELQRKHDSYWMKKLGYRVVTGVGLCVCLAAAKTNSRRNKDLQIGLGLGGFITTVVGGSVLYSLSGEQGRLKTHIEQVNTMKRDWKSSMQ